MRNTNYDRTQGMFNDKTRKQHFINKNMKINFTLPSSATALPFETTNKHE